MSDNWTQNVEPGPAASENAPTGGLVEASRRIGELEAVVAHLVSHLAKNDPGLLRQDTIRKYLGMKGDADDIQAMQSAKARLKPLGMLDCPNCHSKVRDMPGFTDERCIICGHLVGSER